jgi:Arylsulfotransferase (ASST)
LAGLQLGVDDMARLPQLPAAPSSTSQAGAQVFRSRPDLKAPVTTVRTRLDGAAPGLVFTESHGGPADQGPMIIDGKGDLVWFLDLSPGADSSLRAFNFNVQRLRGQPVLTWFQGAVTDGHGEGHYEVWSSDYSKVAEVRGQDGYEGDLHEFVLTDKGTALFTCYGQATTDLSRFGGQTKGDYLYGVVQEVDVSTGELVFQWRSDEHVALDESIGNIRTTTIPWDYFHVNSICVDPTDGNLIISGRNTWAFYKVDRVSGAVLWRLGGKASDFEIGAGAHFAFQHDVRRYANGTVSLFDNEGGPPDEASQSRGVSLALDEQSRRVELLHWYWHSPPVLSDALGSVQELTNNNVFVGWGQSSCFTEYDTAGAAVFDARLAPGTESYRAFKELWSAQPGTEVPAITVVGGTVATIYASYNGCTEVASWVVLGGLSPTGLSRLGQAPRLGFETAITVPAARLYLAVEAVASSGQVLARSEVQRLAYAS